jgi:hypothetical protein
MKRSVFVTLRGSEVIEYEVVDRDAYPDVLLLPPHEHGAGTVSLAVHINDGMIDTVCLHPDGAVVQVDAIWTMIAELGKAVRLCHETCKAERLI